MSLLKAIITNVTISREDIMAKKFVKLKHLLKRYFITFQFHENYYDPKYFDLEHDKSTVVNLRKIPKIVQRQFHGK